MTLLEEVTVALRAQSPELLAATLRALLQRQPVPLRDWRDLFWALAPVYDCAVRLGLDPGPFFAAAGEGLPAEISEPVRRFAGRDDLSLGAFGLVLEDAPDGPAYAWAQ